MGTGFVIRSIVDSTKYLGVHDDPSNDGISVVTVNESSIPSKCVWSISIAAGTGCLIRSYYNSRYLFTNGNTIYTTETTGTSGTDAYYQRVWRLIAVSNMVSRELTAGTEFINLILPVNSSSIFYIDRSPDDAIWSEPSDFTYSSNSSTVSINQSTGEINAISQGETTVTCTHKVTQRVFTFGITIVAAVPYKGTLAHWNADKTNTVGHWSNDIKIYIKNYDSSVVDLDEMVEYAINQWSNTLGVNISITSTKSLADIEVYGGTVEDLQEHLKDEDKSMSGHDALTYYYDGYSGYYKNDGLVKLELSYTSATVCIKYYSEQTETKYKSACVHELGHAFGFIGHSDSSVDVMHKSNVGNYTLTSYDKNHLSQLY